MVDASREKLFEQSLPPKIPLSVQNCLGRRHWQGGVRSFLRVSEQIERREVEGASTRWQEQLDGLCELVARQDAIAARNEVRGPVTRIASHCCSQRGVGIARTVVGICKLHIATRYSQTVQYKVCSWALDGRFWPLISNFHCWRNLPVRQPEKLTQDGHSQVRSDILRPLHVGDIGWIIHRQGVLYAGEYGWDETYEALVAEILGAFVKSFDLKFERAWIAEREDEVVGSVFVVRKSDEVAKLRLLYVEPSARGLGIGRKLVAECIGFARSKGYKTLTLWTNDVLVSARRIYEASGFKLADEEGHHAFGKDLVGQNWDLSLRP